MIAKFSLYDFIAVAMPGIFFVWLLAALSGHAIPGLLSLAVGDLTETSLLVVLGYVVGLLLQGLSQRYTEAALLSIWKGFPSGRWLLPGDGHFTQEYRGELVAALLDRFGISLPLGPVSAENRAELMKRSQEIFYRCYRAVEGDSDLPQTFNAQYGLFRMLVTTFVLLMVFESVLLVRGALGGVLMVDAILRLAVWCAGCVISYWRVTKRGEDFARAVYDLFLAQRVGSVMSKKGSA